MVRLDRIYTRSGDEGSTSLGDGARVPKHDLRIAAYGTVDELGALLGLALAQSPDAPYADELRAVQNDLFDLGADLCVPGESSGRLRLSSVQTARLEGWIDARNDELEPLRSFVLAGGEPLAAWLHLARTVCRRAERLVSALAARPEDRDRVNPEILRYLNRLSDLLFVLARHANDRGRADVLWEPGAGASPGASTSEGGEEGP